MIAIDLPPDVETRLEALAKATGRSTTFYAALAIVEHIDDLEDLYIAEQRLRDIDAGREATVPLAAMMRKHGLAD